MIFDGLDLRQKRLNVTKLSRPNNRLVAQMTKT